MKSTMQLVDPKYFSLVCGGSEIISNEDLARVAAVGAAAGASAAARHAGGYALLGGSGAVAAGGAAAAGPIAAGSLGYAFGTYLYTFEPVMEFSISVAGTVVQALQGIGRIFGFGAGGKDDPPEIVLK